MNPDERKRLLLFVAALYLLVAAAYANILNAPFVFDDRQAITENPTIRSLWPPVLTLPETLRGATSDGRPLVNFSLAVNYALGGLNPAGYHLFNIGVHLFAALALFGLLRRLLTLPDMGEKLREAAFPLAAGTALLWAAHPLQTIAVTYTVQRTEALASLFYLLTLYALVRAHTEDNSSRWLAAGVAACFLGALSKEIIVTAPLAALALDRAFLAGSWREAWARRKGFYLTLASSWLVVGILIALTGLRKGTAGFSVGLGPLAYLQTQAWAVARYLRLALYPHPLVFDYGEQWITDPAQAILPGIVVLALFGAAVYAFAKAPKAGFAPLFFFLVLAPSSSVVPVATPINEQRAYLALAAPMLLVALAAFALLSRAAIKARGYAPLALCAALAVLLAGLTYARNGDYKSQVAIWKDTVEKMPENARATLGLGTAYLDLGDRENAARWFGRTVELNPVDFKALNNLALLHKERGKYPEAARILRDAAKLNPDNPTLYANLGHIQEEGGETRGAVEAFKKSLELDPKNAGVAISLGNALYKLSEYKNSAETFQRAVEIDPENAEARNNLGFTLLILGRPADALAHLEIAVRKIPNYPDVQNNLGRCYLLLNRPADAAKAFKTALHLEPTFQEAREGLEKAENALGK